MARRPHGDPPPQTAPPRRLAPGCPLPEVAFVPGHRPHPRSDGGRAPAALDPQRWRGCQQYLFGIDLFNQGYYWEAHEAWEGLWRESGGGPVTALLQGLIRLAAAGVKVRQGAPESVRRHALAAAALFAQAGGAGTRLCGLELDGLRGLAEHIAAGRWRGDPRRVVEVVFDRPITPLDP